ncbi:16S rRNA (cytidine(1402)-2'-O)-methyltransferase [Candidatus Mycoplasma pogonae]
MKKNKIYLVATPLGNLKDITLRALETLQQVDYIAVEDSRVSTKLLQHYNIAKKLISYHKFNETFAAQKIIDLVNSGYDVALISDAGTPLVSDPGYDLVHLARNNNIELEIIPGPSAFVAAFALSGFSHPLTFLGFLKDKSNQRSQQLANLNDGTYVVYVAPHKLLSTLQDLEIIFPEKNQIFLVKEMTKKFEQHFFGTAQQILQQLPEVIKGEYTMCFEIKTKKNKLPKINKYQQFSKVSN